MGDALTATPALRALRRTWPAARIDVLTTPAGKAALQGLDSVDGVFAVDKHAFDSPAGLVHLPSVAPLLWRLRSAHYDQVLLLHHLTTWFGVLKYKALTRLIGGRAIGLDNGRGRFLDVRVPDAGFGALHEVDYALAVAGAAGAVPLSDPHLELADSPLPPRWERLGEGTPLIALHAGGGSFSLARRWAPRDFATVGASLAQRTGATLVLLGTEVDREASAQVERLLLAAARAQSGDALPTSSQDTGWVDELPRGISEDNATRAQPSSGARSTVREAERCGEVLNLVGRTSLVETAAILRRCKLLVSNDSGVMHLAAAVGTPVVAIFGPSNELAWGPYPPEKHRVVRVTLPCSPCFYRGKSLGRPEGCATRDCLRLVTPEMVIAAAEDLLRR